jgi:hypothetical protein
MHNIFDGLDYSAQTMEHAIKFEKLTNEFFLTIKDVIRRSKAENTSDVSRNIVDSIIFFILVLSEVRGTRFDSFERLY